jgi:DNA-binding NarL/FixJ family response regulator
MASVLGGRTSVRVPFPELTDREREVLDLIAAGRTNAQIAAELFLSGKTVRNNVSTILSKLQAGDRANVIIRARDAGFGHSS